MMKIDILWYLRNVEIHIFVTFAASSMLHESGATALDLHTTPSLLLNMLHISSPMTNDLGPEIESRD